MNKHLFTVIAATVLATSMPVSLFCNKSTTKIHRKQYVRPQIQALKNDMQGMKTLSDEARDNATRFIRKFAQNPTLAMPRAGNTHEQALEKRVVTSYRKIEQATGNHRKSARNYLGNAIATIQLYQPGKTRVYSSLSAERTRNATRVTSQKALNKNARGTTGLAGQLPTKTTKASEGVRRIRSQSKKNEAAASSADELRPLHQKREHRKKIKREQEEKLRKNEKKKQ